MNRSVESENMALKSRPSLKLYSLLYVPEKRTKNANLRSNFNALDTFIRCGSLLASSAEYHGIDFSIVTNNVKLVSAYLKAIGASHVKTVGHQFHRDVPSDITFYAAHFKLDIIQSIGSGLFGDFVGLIDIDTVIVRPFPASLYSAEGLLAYDIGEQVFPQYGRDKILADLERLSGRSLNAPAWYGGEFLLGRSDAFGRIYKYVENVWPAYLANWKKLHHAGDEMVMSAALAMANEDGELLQNAGGAVERWWSIKTGFVQKSWRTASRSCLIHLPADKRFLAAQSNIKFDPEGVLESYERHARKKILLRRLHSVVWPPFSKKRYYFGSIT